MRRLTKFSKEFFQHRKYIKEVEINPKVKSNSFPLKKKFEKNFVNIHWKDEKKSKFHFVWLRDHCQCSKCVEPISTEKISIRENLNLKIQLTSM
jgi:hypothetical protein